MRRWQNTMMATPAQTQTRSGTQSHMVDHIIIALWLGLRLWHMWDLLHFAWIHIACEAFLWRTHIDWGQHRLIPRQCTTHSVHIWILHTRAIFNKSSTKIYSFSLVGVCCAFFEYRQTKRMREKKKNNKKLNWIDLQAVVNFRLNA